MSIEPHWQCSNCRTYNHHSQTYCPYCYELAPAAHTITPAKFGPDVTIGAPEIATLEYADTPSGKAALRGEYGNLVDNTITACHGKDATIEWAYSPGGPWRPFIYDDPSIDRG